MSSIDITADEGAQSEETTIPDVRSTVREEFGNDTWNATEAALATHAALHVKGGQCFGLIIVGPSGAGKTTLLKFFEGLDDQFYRSDDTTPAAWVSQSPDKSEEALEEQDLLPKVRGKSLLCRDTASWFAGTEVQIRDHMSVLANVLDGDGYTRDAGTHGSRGYEGEYPFHIIGATTPLAPRSWQVMGNTGNRLLFHQLGQNETPEDAADAVFDSTPYEERVDRCKREVHDLLTRLSDELGDGVEWEGEPSDELRDTLTYLGKIIAHGRAGLDENGDPQPENLKRVLTTLRDLARGRALLDGRRELRKSDLQVCGRVALSTMQKERRPVVRMLLDPDSEGPFTVGDIASLTAMSENTARKRMKTVARLGFGEFSEREDDDRGTEELTLADEFAWPEELGFPRM